MMESFLKRNMETEGDSRVKRIKKELCPHSVRCFRKNPHHFKEFDHPHLMKLIEMESSIQIPNDFPQPKDVYLEQVEVLKPLLKMSQKSLPVFSNVNLPSSSSSSNRAATVVANKNRSVVVKETTLKTTSITSNQFRLNNGENIKIKSESNTMLDKLERASPYNIFFTTIIKAPQTKQQPNAITFTDLLCPSLGVLKCSLQINFMIDIEWLLKQYKERNLASKPLTILYGDDWPGMEQYIKLCCPNVTSKFIKMKDPFGCHHSKIGIYAYEDNSIRIVVSTANLYYEDWNHYNQGLWVSPACRRLPDSSTETDGESPTKFKKDLSSCLRSYKEPALGSFIEYVQKADFSDIKVFLIYSAPGKYHPNSNGSHLHAVADILSRHCTLPTKDTPQTEGPLDWGIIAQSSSIGNMGKAPAEWLRGSILRCLASHKRCSKPMNSSASLSVVYPTVDNVMTGYFGHESGGCLPYSKAANEKQRWLQDYMYQWKAESYGRTRAMPHIKTYCRVSPCLSKLAYYLLTSANLSKAAWGGPFGKDMGVYIRSYEVGVFFLPSLFGEEYFEISNSTNRKNKQLFPFMYDLPLTSYKRDDYPWCN